MKVHDIELYSQVLINDMITQRATDIHIVPSARNRYLFAYRLHGTLQPWKEMSAKVAERLISHFKYQSGMDIGERRKPQSASMLHRTKTSTYSLRLSTLPALHRESLAIRLLPHVSLNTLSHLSVLQNTQKDLEQICNLAHGLCLLSGPTGSGKTTTLYAIVEQIIKKGGRTIITIEDPIERPIPSIIQVEVNEKAGMTFDAILRASLRHDPDVLLIGEIRDETTATLAIRAALTGHLVLATVHASSCYATLLRMLDLGVSEGDLLQCCHYVLSQRLVETKCPICAGKCDPLCKQSRSMARAALFDVLKGDELVSVMKKGSNEHDNGLFRKAKKAWALGYVTKEEVWRIKNE